MTLLFYKLKEKKLELYAFVKKTNNNIIKFGHIKVIIFVHIVLFTLYARETFPVRLLSAISTDILY